MEREHSLLNPSSCNIWSNCTPSARFAEKFPEETSDYAEEGTLCHSIATDLINYRLKRLTKKQYLINLAEYRAHRLYCPKEMERHAEGFADYVLGIYYGYKQKGWAEIIVEVRVDYGHIAPEGYGHLDVGIISPRCLDVIDLKYGEGVPVSAIVNPQLELYAVGLIEEYKYIDDFEKLNLHIYQPRIDSISVFNTTVKDCLKWAEGNIRRKAELAYAGKGELNAGSWCRFCRARKVCEARAKYHTQLAKYDFQLPYEMSSDQIAEVLLIGESLVNWYTSVKEYATAEARKGVKFPGFKMVNGRSNRRYVDGKEGAIKNALIKAGHKPGDFLKSSIIGVGDMEKLLGVQGFNRLLGKYVVKPPGAPALVPETDARTAMHGKESAKTDFKNIKLKK